MRPLPGVVAVGGVSAMPFAAAKMLIRVPLTVAGRPPAMGESALVTASTVEGDYCAHRRAPVLVRRRSHRLADPLALQRHQLRCRSDRDCRRGTS